MVLLSGLSSAAPDWTADRTVNGIDLQSQPRETGFTAYRGSVTVCAGLDELQAFVADASRFHEWLPYTEEARNLECPESGGELYYLRNSAPWPLRTADGRTHVRLSLAVKPGRAPAYFVNRRLAATVGGTLANLQEPFPCAAD